MTTPILFNVLDDHVILRSSNGIYRQAKVATRKGYLYASIGSSFVMLQDAQGGPVRGLLSFGLHG